MNFNILYKKSVKGAIQTWQIFVDGASYYTEAGQMNGAITRSLPTVTKAKNTGKANATTDEEQAVVEAQAKYDKKLKEGYVENIDNIDNVTFIKPILAHPIKKRVKPITYPVLVQSKRNGVRCIISKNGAFSRKGEQFHNVDHILKEFEGIFNDYPYLVFDGELEDPDDQKNLNRLIKLVAVTRGLKDITPELRGESEKLVRFKVYDGYLEGEENVSYTERMLLIESYISDKKYSSMLSSEVANNEDEMYAIANRWIADGYEGGIVRMPNMVYEHKRSMDLLKIKRGEDAEFEAIDVLEGEGNWSGCAKKITCKLEPEYHKFGKTTFNANLEGTMEFCRDLLINKQRVIGKKITVRFQDRSEYGVPAIPYTNGIVRNYE